MMFNSEAISAIVLGAGLSSRMGREKLLLPWQNSTVLETIVSTLNSCKIGEILIVIRPAQEKVLGLVNQLASYFPLRPVFVDDFSAENMLASLQSGIHHVSSSCTAGLLTLGDQPFIQKEVVLGLLATFKSTGARLVVPSYNNHRGHPWLVSHHLFKGIMHTKPPSTLRDFIHSKQRFITYYPVNSESVLMDIDTPEEYVQFQQRLSSENDRSLS